MTPQSSNKAIGLLAATLLGVCGSASAGLVLHYTFDSDDATNSGALGDGAAFGGVTYAASGAGAGSGNAAVFNRAGTNDAGIDTNLSASNLGIAGTGGYTAMAWISYGGAGGDNMVFGQDRNNALTSSNDAQLHHGIRNDGGNANQHSGHWGNDLTDLGSTIPTDSTWVHVAFVYDGANLTQYLNGAVNGGPEVRGPLNASADAFDVTIGWTDRSNNGSFDGMIDEVKIFNEVLDASQIQFQSRIGVPEPASTGLLCLASLGLLMRRRK